MQRLWRGEAVVPAVAADGSTGTAGAAVWCEPRPVQPGGVPLWISGRLHDRTLDRMARFGAGWIPWGEHRRDVVSGIPRVHAALEAAGRDPAGFGVRATLPVVMDDGGRVDGDRTVAPVPPMAEAGVTDFGLFGAFSADDDTAGEQLSMVVSAFAAATGRAGARS
jgi:alkanesulfonate monooxygenase SsuD/methylene tetrahydromethanopterin reductase-like flavin-dependent oxidoreductase (luciferase family)